MTRKAIPIAVLAITMLVACNDDAARPGTTPPVVTVIAGPSTAPTSSTTTSTTSTTVPAPSTTSVEDLKAQIAADYERAFYRRYELVAAPTLDNIEANVAEVMAKNSVLYVQIVKRIKDLVAAGDRVERNTPDLLKVTVEKVELVGDPPFTKAVATICQVDNLKQVTPAENSPTGSEVEVVGTGDLIASRIADPVMLTDHGWLPYSADRPATDFEGQDSCPAP